MRFLFLMAAAGLTACAEPVSTSGLCAGMRGTMTGLRGALEAHPETPQPVGEYGTSAVLGMEAGCGW